MNVFSDKYSQNGLTLVEVLIAMLILVVAIVGWMGAQQSSVLNRGQSRTMTVATELVHSKIEELSADPAKACSGNSCSGQNELNIGGLNYSLDWEMNRINSDGNILTYGRPLWIIEVNGNWRYRGNKNTIARRVVME